MSNKGHQKPPIFKKKKKKYFFCVFQLYYTKSAENEDFDQCLVCAAPKCLSKYTTAKVQGPKTPYPKTGVPGLQGQHTLGPKGCHISVERYYTVTQTASPPGLVVYHVVTFVVITVEIVYIFCMFFLLLYHNLILLQLIL